MLEKYSMYGCGVGEKHETVFDGWQEFACGWRSCKGCCFLDGRIFAQIIDLFMME